MRSLRSSSPAASTASTPVAVACGAALLLAGCSNDDGVPLQRVADGKAEVTGRGVLVIVIDGLRWDHTSLAGYDRDTTPFLRQFAKSSVVFEDAWAATASPLGSHIAILSGCDPSIAQPPTAMESVPGAPTARGDAWFIPEGLELLSQPFLGSGWRTAAFVDHPMIAELRGFDRGFVEFIEFGGSREPKTQEIGVFGVGRRFVRWLNGLAIDQDWFAYVHMNDLERVWSAGQDERLQEAVEQATAHWRPRPDLARVPPLGYVEPTLHALPPSRARAGEPLSLAEYELRYDRGLRAIDASLRRLIGHADEFERADLITVVIAGSFGTALGEDGLYLQAGLVGEGDLHVPLVVRPSRALRESLGWRREGSGSGSASGPGRSANLASLIDLAPTLTDLYGLRPPRQMHGLSLRRAMTAPDARDRDEVAPRRAVAFLDSSLVPGDGIITESRRYADYRGTGRFAALQDVFEPRQANAGDPTVAREAFVELGHRWESLLLDHRRWLHFGGGEADISRVEELRTLQAQPVSRSLEHPRDTPRTGSGIGTNGSDGPDGPGGH